MDLQKKVMDYYWEHFATLPHDKQFHFAGRLWLWRHDNKSQETLSALRTQYTTSSIDAERKKLSSMLSEQPNIEHINGNTLRADYFEKYPQLYGLELALFRIRHLLVYYNEDHRSTLLSLVSRSELQTLRDSLLEDTKAIQMLSTYAVNYLYLAGNLELLPRLETRHLSTIVALGNAYDKQDRAQLQLYIYLFTHCIIADTNFYEAPLHPAYKKYYIKMIDSLTHDITNEYKSTTLDTKLEYLVCCKVIGFTSPLAQRIINEAKQNISHEGTFIVDPTYPKDHRKNSLSGAEHRNVLFIMTGSEYEPSN